MALYKVAIIVIVINMHVRCRSCGKEYNNLVGGVKYSSNIIGFLAFCSDNCCKDYLNTLGRKTNVAGHL
jgi:hypothetical protein